MQSWFKEKHGKQINLDVFSKQEAPQLLKHFFLEIRQTTKENKGKGYQPGTLQTYRNGLRRYFLGRPCPPAVDNLDLEKSSAIEFEEVSTMLSMKKKDLKQKGLGTNQMPLNQLKQKILKRCGRQVQSAFKILALFSIWCGGIMSRTWEIE